MLEAIREAEASIAQGGLPIGAVLTRDNKIIARGHNNRVQENNPILHGEMSCLREAGVISFHDTVMYTTLSPCSMCAGALGLFKVSLVVIGESETFPGSKDILEKFGIPYLDLGVDVAGFDLVAFLLQPLGEVALLHRRRKSGHQDVDGHADLTKNFSKCRPRK